MLENVSIECALAKIYDHCCVLHKIAMKFICDVEVFNLPIVSGVTISTHRNMKLIIIYYCCENDGWSDRTPPKSRRTLQNKSCSCM